MRLVTHPKHHVQKIYQVTTDKPYSQKLANALIQGIDIGEPPLARAVASEIIRNGIVHRYCQKYQPSRMPQPLEDAKEQKNKEGQQRKGRCV